MELAQLLSDDQTMMGLPMEHIGFLRGRNVI
jgi:hypothetical protein